MVKLEGAIKEIGVWAVKLNLEHDIETEVKVAVIRARRKSSLAQDTVPRSSPRRDGSDVCRSPFEDRSGYSGCVLFTDGSFQSEIRLVETNDLMPARRDDAWNGPDIRR